MRNPLKLLIGIIFTTFITIPLYAQSTTQSYVTYIPSPLSKTAMTQDVPTTQASIPYNCTTTTHLGSKYMDSSDPTTIQWCLDDGTGTLGWKSLDIGIWDKNGTNVFLQDWANPNMRVGIGTSTPGSTLDVNGDICLGLNCGGDPFAQHDLKFAPDGGGFGMQFDYLNTKLLIGTLTGTWHMTIQDNGNIGINATTPLARLHVNGNTRTDGNSDLNGDLDVNGNSTFIGNVQIQDGTEANGRILTSDAAGNANWQDRGVPQGMIAFFAGICPSGWTTYGPANGRYIVASNTANANTYGPQLTPGELRTDVPSHNHNVIEPDPPGPTPPGHSHPRVCWAKNAYNRTASGVSYDVLWNIGASCNGGDPAYNANKARLAAVGEPWQNPTAGSAPYQTTGVTISPTSGPVPKPIAPYIELRACRKN